MDTIADLAPLSAEITEFGLKLDRLRGERRTLDGEIAELEARIIPLLHRHAAIIQSISSAASPPSPPRQATPYESLPAPNLSENQPEPKRAAGSSLERKVREYLDTCSDETEPNPFTVAAALKVNPHAVRIIMQKISMSSPQARQLEVADDEDDPYLPGT